MNKKYWLRWALVLTIIHFVAWCVSAIVAFSVADPVSKGFAWFPLAIADILVANDSFIKLFNWADSLTGITIFLVIFGSLQWFVIGGIIGWIYGKIKNKQSSLHQ